MRPNQLIPIATIVVFITHFAGEFFRLYDLFPRFDSFVHFLGGLWVASVIVGFGETRLKFSVLKDNTFLNFLIIISLTTLIGTFWEFFEFAVYKISFLTGNFYQPQTWPNTLSDLFFDMVGAGVTSFLLFFNRHFSYQRQIPPL